MLDKANSQELIVSEESVYLRFKTNDILSQKRDFNLIGMSALIELQGCLNIETQEFDIPKYKDKIIKLETQINIWNTILDLINKWALTAEAWTDKQQEEETQKLKDTVQNNLNNLESSKKKLEEFLNKVPLITQYKEDTNKYTKEILEIIDIIN